MTFFFLPLLVIPSDVKPFCHKRVTGKVKGGTVGVELDGMATSLSRALLIERKPLFKLEHVEELDSKAERLR